MQRYSLLDLAIIAEGSTAADALANTVGMSQHAEKLGYHRYWLAEHHNMTGIASAATSVVIGHVAAATKTMRIGAGGVMLPNHSPLVIAEHYGTLATLFPDRIDLGLGRAPGTDGITVQALRRNMKAEDSFPQDVMELINYFEPAHEGTQIRATPGEGTQVPVYILGSSLYSAQLAAKLGLPYTFASHFSPDLLDQAAKIYHSQFQPSKWLSKPYFMITIRVCAADTDEEAQFIRSSETLLFSNLFMGSPGKLPAPVENLSALVPPHILQQVQHMHSFAAVGDKATVSDRLAQMINRYRPDEVIITTNTYTQESRLKSIQIAAEAISSLPSE